jgi:hypothetical protein
MARWVLGCPHCNEDFTHKEVRSDTGAFAWSAVKPEFPDGGLNVICPNCNKLSVYQRSELTYHTS